MEDKTLTLEEAAKFLGFSHTGRLRIKAYKGIIPACKPGRNWVFYLPDLVQWMRDQYNARREAAQVGIGGKQWQSLKRKADVICIQNSCSVESELMKVRKQIREQRLKNMKTNDVEI